MTSPHESSHPQDNWGFVVSYLNAVSRSNTTASIKNLTTTCTAATAATLAHNAASARRIFAFRAISDDIDDPTTLSHSNANATLRSRHLHSTIRAAPLAANSRNQNETGEDDEQEDGCISSKQKVATIVELLRQCCIDAGALDPNDEQGQDGQPFVTHKTIQRYVDRCSFARV